MRIIAFLIALTLLFGCKNQEEIMRVNEHTDSSSLTLVTERTADTAIKIDRKEVDLFIPILNPGLNTTLSRSKGHAQVTAIIENGKVTSVNCTCDSLEKVIQIREKQIAQFKEESKQYSFENERITTQAIPWYYKLSAVISIVAIGYLTTKIILKIQSFQNPLS